MDKIKNLKLDLETWNLKSSLNSCHSSRGMFPLDQTFTHPQTVFICVHLWIPSHIGSGTSILLDFQAFANLVKNKSRCSRLHFRDNRSVSNQKRQFRNTAFRL